jgi:hypothetical protein
MHLRNLAPVVLLIILLTASDDASQVQDSKQSPRLHQQTEWSIVPSQAFDVLCFLNTLTGDSFYVDYYRDDYAKFAPKLTPEAKTALANLKRVIKDEGQNIISAALCLYFSATSDSTIDDLLATLAESSQMKANLKLTPYYSDEGWQMYESVKGDLVTVLRFLKGIEFEKYWRDNILPIETARIDSIKTILPKYNIIPLVENAIGFSLASDKITVYMLYYAQPHGIKITGTRFLSDVSYPFEIVVRNAVHEMMHPPVPSSGDSVLVATTKLLEKDEFLMDKVLHHNPSFGYNSLPDLIEEDCVQALEQTINEQLKIEREAHKRWLESDDGIHVFAVALYQVMKRERFNEKHELFRDFLIRNIQSGNLGPGRIKSLYDGFYATSGKGK